jgi:hypothetical protein
MMCNDIAGILMKVSLNTINQSIDYNRMIIIWYKTSNACSW